MRTIPYTYPYFARWIGLEKTEMLKCFYDEVYYPDSVDTRHGHTEADKARLKAKFESPDYQAQLKQKLSPEPKSPAEVATWLELDANWHMFKVFYNIHYVIDFLKAPHEHSDADKVRLLARFRDPEAAWATLPKHSGIALTLEDAAKWLGVKADTNRFKSFYAMAFLPASLKADWELDDFHKQQMLHLYNKQTEFWNLVTTPLSRENLADWLGFDADTTRFKRFYDLAYRPSVLKAPYFPTEAQHTLFYELFKDKSQPWNEEKVAPVRPPPPEEHNTPVLLPVVKKVNDHPSMFTRMHRFMCTRFF